MNYSNDQLLERYLRGECSDEEKVHFEQLLQHDSELQKSFSELKLYYELLHGAKNYTASEQFTDNVVRKIRTRADERSFQWKKLWQGLFSKEIAGVVVTVIVLAFIFRSQMGGIVPTYESNDFASDAMVQRELAQDAESEEIAEAAPMVQERKETAPMAASNVAVQKSVVPQALSKGTVPQKKKVAISSLGNSGVSVEKKSSKPVPMKLSEAEFKQRRRSKEESDLDALFSEAPKVLTPKERAASRTPTPDNVIARSKKSVATVESYSESAPIVIEERRTFEDHVAGMSEMTEMTDEAIDVAKIAADTAVSDSAFPFEKYGITDYRFNDTMSVTVPDSTFESFLKAWKAYGGGVNMIVEGEHGKTCTITK